MKYIWIQSEDGEHMRKAYQSMFKVDMVRFSKGDALRLSTDGKLEWSYLKEGNWTIYRVASDIQEDQPSVKVEVEFDKRLEDLIMGVPAQIWGNSSVHGLKEEYYKLFSAIYGNDKSNDPPGIMDRLKRIEDKLGIVRG